MDVRYKVHAGALLLATLALAACGGGSETPTPATSLAPSAAPASALTITSFSPTSGAPGTVITVVGSGFAGVQSARIGTQSAPYLLGNDAQLQVTVPAGAVSGRIELSAAGRTVATGADFAVIAVPQVASITPLSVTAGSRVTLTGSALDRVREVRLNTTVLPITLQSATSLQVDVVATATSGVLTLVDADGAARPLAQQLTVSTPMTLTSFTPASIVTGSVLTVNGTTLDRAVSVIFANGTTAPVATRAGTTRITVTVPDAAVSGAIRVAGNLGDEVTAATPLIVIPAIRVDANAIYPVTAAGANVTVNGSGLTEVSTVLVGTTNAPIVSKTATQLVFTVPAGVTCGALVLQSGSQPAVAAGSVVVGGGCAASLAAVEFAQVYAQPITDPRQKLVPGKETWVRAIVLASQAGIASPVVRLTGYRGATILGTLDMNGPATLPVGSGTTVPDAVRYSEAQSFNAELPAGWVASGLSVRVEVDVDRRLGPTITADAAPRVGSPTRLNIVLVPLVSGSFSPTMPSTDAVLNELERRFPLARSNITVSVRAAYTLSSVTDGLNTDTEWPAALSELRQLRDLENPGNAYRYYYGVVRRSGGGIAGIGYVPGRTALGWDSAAGWARTMSHELGHNFSRSHAPCGGVASPDPNYPYAGGLLGPTALVDAIPAALDVVAPTTLSDIMGYCGGTWFSDYNYVAMQTHLEAQPQSAMASALTVGGTPAAPVATPLVLVSGAIGLDGVTFNPVQALRGRPLVAGGEYTLRLVTRDGRTIEHAFDAELVDHALPPQRHFAVTLVDPGPIASLQVLRGGQAVPLKTDSRVTAQRASPSVSTPLSVDWNERDGQLEARWTASAAPLLSVTHVGVERTVLAINRRGGTLSISTAQLPAGGHFEFALSDGVNAQLLTASR